MRILRLVLGDQLNIKHSWFQKVDPQVTYLIAEMQQESSYVKHHVQKVVAFFMAMRNFVQELQEKGHAVRYFNIDDPENPKP